MLWCYNKDQTNLNTGPRPNLIIPVHWFNCKELLFKHEVYYDLKQNQKENDEVVFLLQKIIRGRWAWNQMISKSHNISTKQNENPVSFIIIYQKCLTYGHRALNYMNKSN